MLHPWDSAFLDLHRQVDEMFEKLVYRPWSISGRSSWRPALDLHELADAYLVDIDLPDVVPEEVRIVIGQRDLLITGQRQAEPPEGLLCQRCERPSGAFERTVNLPEAVDPQEARAEYRHGVCRIHLPKKRSPEQAATTGAAPGTVPQLEQSHLAAEGARYVLRLDVR